MRRHLTAFLCCLLCALSVQAEDLPEIRARGELRHLGIRYANFVTGSGDGFDVELVRGFAEHLGVHKWARRIKVLGRVPEQQLLAAAFSKDSPPLRAAFDDYRRELKRDARYDLLVDHYYPGIRRYFPAFFASYG